jgi:hypothetical protein
MSWGRELRGVHKEVADAYNESGAEPDDPTLRRVLHFLFANGKVEQRQTADTAPAPEQATADTGEQ